MMRARTRNRGVLALIAVLAGCGGSGSDKAAPPKPSFRGMKLVAAVLGDEAIIPGLESQRGEWSASSGAELSFKSLSMPVAAKDLAGVDVVIFSGDLVGGLVDEGALLVFPEDALRPPPPASKDGDDATPEPPPDPFALNDVAVAYRDQATKYGPDRVALPLGGTALVLVYHREAFERAENQAAAKSAGITLGPPKTWADLDALARFFHGRDWNGDGTPDAGIALSWSDDPEGLANATFLARAASLGLHSDQYSFLFDSDRMAPRIASPPFVEALQGIVGLARLAPPGVETFDAEAARAAFRSGRVALLIDRAERASTWSAGKPVGVAPLPGSERVYNPDRKGWETPSTPNRPSYLPRGGGWFVAVAAASPHRDGAIDLAKYLAGPEVTNRLRSDRGFPMLATRNVQLGQGLGDPRLAPGVESRSWSDAVSKTFNATRVAISLRIPEADGYLADLTRGRVAAVAGQPAGAALGAVAEAWEKRTDRIGRERQVWNYRRSLNSLVTTPEPPPRGSSSGQ